MNLGSGALDEQPTNDTVHGEFIDFADERFYAIRHVDQMPAFFVSVISDSDHWLFISSNGGLTAGRVSPDTALFPYTTVDKIHDSALHTGSKTIFRIAGKNSSRVWEPFNREHDSRFATSRHLYKNVLGNRLCFEETNHDLGLRYRYLWATSEAYGFVRQCELTNLNDGQVSVELLDGLQNILPAGTPRVAQTNTSNLVDAYKWSELDAATGLASYVLYSGITDRAEPCESLRANTVFCLGLTSPQILLSNEHLAAFRAGRAIETDSHTRGIRGAYLARASLTLAGHETGRWQFVADTEQSQAEVVALLAKLADTDDISDEIQRSISAGSDQLARIIANADGFQCTDEENVSVHHYANVLFNILRGGIIDDQYRISGRDFRASVRHFNRAVYARNAEMLQALPAKIDFKALRERVSACNDPQLERLCKEYLPIRFGRRHGDPSRPWNQFAIKLTDRHGDPLLSYEGNWRDIFQNWEALMFSYPEFIENVIGKFVNASTMDGYNPYRITKEGIDWEVEEPDDPWSYIGYWGDHQIIYLLKLLELSAHFHPQRLSEMLHQPVFCYANVPYRIRDFEALLQDPKTTVDYDEPAAALIEQRVAQMGADGRLVLDGHGDVYQVSLLEKLLVPLLTKLSNLVIDGGIWLNTQRPEWNDANNALVGQGLSMVTLYYLRRYLTFMQSILEDQDDVITLSTEVADWLQATNVALASVQSALGDDAIDASQRFQTLRALGSAASDYRQRVYRNAGFTGRSEERLTTIQSLLAHALTAVDHSIATNRRDDGLYHAYNLLRVENDRASVETLYPMLEGQVAVLSAGAIEPAQAASVVEQLFTSSVYRADQHSFMLYPDRPLPSFLEKNRMDEAAVMAVPLLRDLLAAGNQTVVQRDARGDYRFHPRFTNARELSAALSELPSEFAETAVQSHEALKALYEKVFNHQAFTGRSGGMFGFEGLGSIYWHMVSKLLLAVQENFFAAVDKNDASRDRLADLYYRVRAGIGFNKSPEEYGAFPTDPYSHTPKHAGARQPGMTGQVKEEVLTRFGELGVRVHNGVVTFNPCLLRRCEFISSPQTFRYLATNNEWQQLELPANALAFTWCQVPIVYRLADKDGTQQITLRFSDGREQQVVGDTLNAEDSRAIFARDGELSGVAVSISPKVLCSVPSEAGAR